MSESILYKANKDLKVELLHSYKNSYVLAPKVLEEVWRDVYMSTDFSMFMLEMNFGKFRKMLIKDKDRLKSERCNYNFILLEFFTAQAFYVKDRDKVILALEYIKPYLEGHSLEYLNTLIEDIKTISEDDLLFMYTPTSVSDVWESRMFLDTEYYLEYTEQFPNVKEDKHDLSKDELECSLDERVGQQAGGVVIFDEEGIAQTQGYRDYDFNSYESGGSK